MARAEEEFCYLTTTGRRSGRPHEIEIWYGAAGDTVYMLSGGGRRADWVRNLIEHPAVSVRIGAEVRNGTARLVTDPVEDDLARRLLAGKYQGWKAGAEMSGWANSALAVAVDLT